MGKSPVAVSVYTLDPAEARRTFSRAFARDENPFILTSGSDGSGWLAREAGDETLTLHVSVRLGYRRRGVGSALLAGLLEEAGRRGAQVVRSSVMLRVPGEQSFSTPSPEVRFCQHHGFEESEEFDTFHLDGDEAIRLLERLDRLQERFGGQGLSWISADEVDIDKLAQFLEKHIQLAEVGAGPFLRIRKFFPQFSPVALRPDGEIAGAAVVGCHPVLVDRLHYHYLAMDPSYRQSTLVAEILRRSIRVGWEEGWRGSEFKVQRTRKSAMWRFASSHGRAVYRHAFFQKVL